MPISAFSGAFNTTTQSVGSTVSVTGLSFQPKAIVFFWSGATTTSDQTVGGDQQTGIGFATGSASRRFVSGQSQDAQALSNTDKGHRDDACVGVHRLSDGAHIGLLDVQSFDSGGFTLVTDSTFTANYRISYLALGGDSITQATTGVFIEPAGIGYQNTTNVGFQPNFIMFASSGMTTDPPGIAVIKVLTVGMAASFSQAVVSGRSPNGSNITANQMYGYSGECVAFAGADLVDARASFLGFVSGGWTLDWNERASLRRIHYLAIKGGSYYVGKLTTKETAGSTIVVTGAGFSPSAGFFLGNGIAESTQDTTSPNDRMSMGAFGGVSNRIAQGYFDEDNVDTGEVARGVEHDEVYLNISTTDAIDGLLDIQSADSDGFTAVMDDGDPTPATVYFALFGPAEVSESGVVRSQENRRGYPHRRPNPNSNIPSVRDRIVH